MSRPFGDHCNGNFLSRGFRLFTVSTGEKQKNHYYQNQADPSPEHFKILAKLLFKDLENYFPT
jgi:hypothetical protein